MAGDGIKVVLDVKEVERIRDKLKELGGFATLGSPSVAKVAISAAGGVIRDKAKRFAPVRSSGRSSVSKANRYARSRGWKIVRLAASLKVKTFGNFRAKVYAAKPTGHLIEFGHATRLGKPMPNSKREYYRRGYLSRTRAIPFLAPGIEQGSQPAVDKMVEILSARLDAIAKR